MTISEMKEVLDEANCCYEIIEQDKPILSVLDAESFILQKSQHQHLFCKQKMALLAV